MDKQPECDFFRKYRNAILFNRNLISSSAGGFIASAFISQLYYSYYPGGDFATSVVALATEYAVYVPLFALLFYVDNRHTSISIRRPAKGMIDRIWKKKGKGYCSLDRLCNSIYYYHPV